MESLKESTITTGRKVFVLSSFVYLSYFSSLAVVGPFLSLYFQSKGFDGSTLGFLSSLTPLTTFLMAPIWGMIQQSTTSSSSSKKDSIISFPVLYGTVFLAMAFQVLIGYLDHLYPLVIVKILSGIFHAPIKPMMDALILEYLPDRSSFGKLRLFGILGSGLGTVLGGKLIEMNRLESQYLLGMGEFLNSMSEFDLLFLAHIFLTIPTLLGIRKLQLAGDESNNASIPLEPDQNIPKSSPVTSAESKPKGLQKILFGDVLSDVNNILFFVVIYIMGTSGGVSDTFTYVRFREVGCSTSQMGISRMLSSTAGAIMFWFSGIVSDWFGGSGNHNVLIFSLLCGGTRFHFLQIMDKDSYYYGYVGETIRGGLFGLFWSSATIHASHMVPPSLRASMLLLLNGVYNGIGRSTGALLGGKIQAASGTEKLFFYMSLLNMATAIFLALYCQIIKKSKANIWSSEKST